MATIRVTAILDQEKTRIDGLLSVVPEPSNYVAYLMKKSLSHIARMRQQVGETDTDYAERINIEAQGASPGFWSTSFWANLDAAVAADTSEGSRGGRGRAD